MSWPLLSLLIGVGLVGPALGLWFVLGRRPKPAAPNSDGSAPSEPSLSAMPSRGHATVSAIPSGLPAETGPIAEFGGSDRKIDSPTDAEMPGSQIAADEDEISKNVSTGDSKDEAAHDVLRNVFNPAAPAEEPAAQEAGPTTNGEADRREESGEHSRSLPDRVETDLSNAKSPRRNDGGVWHSERSATPVISGDVQLTSAIEDKPASESSGGDLSLPIELQRNEPLADQQDEDTNGKPEQPRALGSKVTTARQDMEAGLIEARLPADAGDGADQGEPIAEAAGDELRMEANHRQSKPARHRDRRGQRRAPQPQPKAESKQTASGVEPVLRPAAEARLRLMLHPVRRAASLSVVLARPVGYPDRITLIQQTRSEVAAYNDSRYDDVDVEWTGNLLSGEVRLDCEEGYRWLRSSRRIHIFSGIPDEPGLMSVGSATMTSTSAIVCSEVDVGAVHSAAKACGSPDLVSHDHWAGVPAGWTVLSGYRPTQAASAALEAGLTGLDPGVGAAIGLSGGLQIRAGVFAEGSPPRIEITPFPAGAAVTIDRTPATMEDDGSWRAHGWDTPGDHLIDVVPGPSMAYRILADPWTSGGWESWDAHPGRFTSSQAPWAQAQICGASLLGPLGEYVLAAEEMATVAALGLRCGFAALRKRPDVPVSVGLLAEPPAFLISASGPRRAQGRVTWLDPSAPSAPARGIDLQWLAAIRSAAARRLPLIGASAVGQEAWRRAKERARRHRKAGR